jgi:hypothetical protein
MVTHFPLLKVPKELHALRKAPAPFIHFKTNQKYENTTIALPMF